MILLTPPPHVQAAIAAACAAEEERFPRLDRGATPGDRTFTKAYQQALKLACRLGFTVSFHYRGMECFATPGEALVGHQGS